MSKTFNGSYSSGITLSNSGYNPVSVTGTIEAGTGTALYGTVGTAWTITNHGTIATADGGAAGITLASGGTVTNAASALIAGYTGIFVSGAPGFVTNSGTISINAGPGDAVFLADGGTVSNLPGATIVGGGVGIETGVAGTTTVFNQGDINATNALVGIAIHDPGYISNAMSGVITGTQFGAYFTKGAGTIVNAGTIGEIGGGAVTGSGVGFAVGYTSRLIDEPGAVFLGLVTGANTIGATAISTLELASAVSGGTLSGLGTQFIDFAQVTVDAGASWTLAGSNTNVAGAMLTSGGALISSGTLANSGNVSGVVELTSGTVTNAAGATMSGDPAAIYGPSGASAGTVLNAGTLIGGTNPTHSAGVVLFSGGLVSNASTGTIEGGGVGVLLGSASTSTNAGTIVNYGLLEGTSTHSNGIEVTGGGLVSNAAGGTITGSNQGVLFDSQYSLQSAVVLNQGLIESGGTGSGVYLQSGGTVSNTGTGHIIGNQWGVQFGNSGSAVGTLVNTSYIAATGSGGGAVNFLSAGLLTNAGTIGAPGAAIAVSFEPAYTNRLVIDPGAVFNGTVNGGNPLGSTIFSTLEFASGATGGTLGGLGTQFFDFAQITIDSGATWTLTGSNVNPIGAALTSSGTLIVASSLSNSGTVAGIVTLASGASLSNLSGAVMKRASGGNIYSDSSGVTVTNAGLITNSSTKAAIALKDGGLVNNDAVGATIVGSQHTALYVTGASGVVLNAGTIESLGNATSGVVGVVLDAGGYVSNASTGLISSSYGIGVYMKGSAGTVINAGRIAQLGSGGVGAVALMTGGVVDNTGTITSALRVGVYINGGAGTLINDGHILANGTHTAVVFDVGGSVTNQAGGTIVGGTAHSAIYMTGSIGNVVNYGLLVGGSTATGVVFDAGGNVTNRSGGVIESATGSSGIFITGATAGTVVNYGVIENVNVASGGRVVNESGGTIASVFLPSTASSTLVVHPSATFTGSVNAGGSESVLELAPSLPGTLTGLGTQFNNFGSILFDVGANWFIAGSTSGLAGTISGFAVGDTIEVTGVTATGSSYVGGVLTLEEASGSATLNLPGTFSPASFEVVTVSGGTDVSLVAPCFRAGTRIRTARGEVVVEDLRVGQSVLAEFGDGVVAPRSILWIGYRMVDCRHHPKPEQIWPVRVAVGAFGARTPRRDLWLSPDHAVFVDGVLIPIKHLINGTTIAQVRMDEVAYYHVELERHGVLLAEGLTCESFLDTGNRANFANNGGAITLHPDFTALGWDAGGCAPLVVTGALVDAVRRRVNARAARRVARVA